MRSLRYLVLLVLFLSPVLLSATGSEALAKDLTQQLTDAENRADNWRTAFFVITALYVFVYFMGRRRLVKKIWARNKDLKAALDKAQESDRLKTAFIRNMSHEIRTPLNAINGFSQLLCSPGYELTPQEREDMLHRISKSSESITTIVAELLDMSEGESVHDRVQVNVNALCREMIEDLKHRNEKGLDIKYKSSLDDDFSFLSSDVNLRRILRHLLGNALKFTQKGSITLSGEKRGNQLVLGVADTGIGVVKKHREHIFENFVKLDDYVEGVGLGLPLSRRLARVMGGDVTLDTSYMGGSRFLVTLPLK